MKTIYYNHDELLKSLDEHVKHPDKINFKEPNLNGWASGNGFGLPDLITVPCSHANFVRKIYEVKASQSDLLGDLREEKWTRYLPLADRFIFAIQHPIDYKKYLWHLPVGIMVFKNNKWRTVRAAPINNRAEPWNEAVWRSLLFGRMMNKKRDNRLERLEAECIVMRREELKELYFAKNRQLSKRYTELYSLESRLKTKQANLEEKEKNIEGQVREKLLKQITHCFGGWIPTVPATMNSAVNSILEIVKTEAKKQILQKFENMKEVANESET